MISPIKETYYQYEWNGFLYKEGVPEEVQREAYKAMVYTAEIFDKNPDIKKQSESWQFVISGKTFAPLCDPLVWVIDSHIDSNKSCCTLNNWCGTSRNDTLTIMLLMTLLVGLVAAPLASFGVMVYQGCNAEKTRQKLNEIKALKEQANKQSVKDTYDAMIPILREQYADKSASTLSTAVITVGLSFLTATAIMALYAHILAIPFPAFFSAFSITGWSVFGVGVLLHVTRLVVHYFFREQAREKFYKDLFQHYFTLYEFVSNPIEILDASREPKAYLTTHGCTFFKEEDGSHAWMLEKERMKSIEGYTCLEYIIKA